MELPLHLAFWVAKASLLIIIINIPALHPLFPLLLLLSQNGRSNCQTLLHIRLLRHQIIIFDSFMHFAVVLLSVIIIIIVIVVEAIVVSTIVSFLIVPFPLVLVGYFAT